MIRRKLHDERGGLAREGLGLLEDDAGDDDGRNADEVGARRDPPRAAEDRARHQGDNRHLRAAGDEGRGHDRHAAVTLLLDGAGGHDAGHAAARADQHRDEALAGEAEAAEDAIHDERDARHIAAILQNAQQQEQHEHLRHEAEHRADAADDTVHDQTGEPVGAADALKEALRRRNDPLADENVVRPIGQRAADGGNGDVIHQRHHRGEDRQAEDSVGQHAVDLVAGAHAAVALLHAAVDDGGDIGVARGGDNGLAVVVHLGLAGLDVVLNVCELILRDVQLLDDALVALEDLDGEPALPLLRHVVQHDLLDVRQRMLDAARKAMLRDGLLAAARHLHRALRRFHHAVALERGNLDHRHAEVVGELRRVDAVAVPADDIHHVQRDDHRNPQLSELRGQIQVALQIGCVDDVEQRVRALVDQHVAGDDFLHRVRAEGINARKVGDDDVLFALEAAFLLFNRNARPVADELVGAGQRVEQRCLAAVRVTGKRDLDLHDHSSSVRFS